MTDRLKRLQALYEGGLNGESSDDTRLRQEMDDLREMKDLLDARPRRRPRPSTVAAVLAAARSHVDELSGEPAAAELEKPDDVLRGPRTDRPPKARRRAIVLRIGATSALVAVLLAVVGILQLNLLDPAVHSFRSGAEETLALDENASHTPQNPTAAEESAAAPETGSGGADGRGSGASGSDGRESEVPESAAPLADAAAMNARPSPSQEPTGTRAAQQERGRTAVVAPNNARTNVPETSAPFSPRPQAPTGSLTKAYADSFSGSAANSAHFAGDIAEVDIGDYSDVLSWEQQGDVMEVSQHIDLVGGDVAMEWESPSVPLEMMPENRSREPFFQQAGERRTP